MHVVVNHLRLRDPVTDATLSLFSDGVRIAVDAGALSARIAKVDERHVVLILDFPSAEEADRVARGAGGAWMREHIRPLLAGDTDRSLGEVVAAAEA